MRPLQLADKTIALRLPDIPDRFALYEAYRSYAKKSAALVRLRAAAIGLAWPGDQVPPPWNGGLSDHDWDLVAFGTTVLKALATETNKLELDIGGDIATAEIIRSILPPEKLKKKTDAFLEQEETKPSGSDTASRSDTATSETPSPSSD